jgi:hypothetical protein
MEKWAFTVAHRSSPGNVSSSINRLHPIHGEKKAILLLAN